MLNVIFVNYSTPVPFALTTSFFDPLLTSDGQPYGPERYKDIVRERYIISKNINTSYSDTADISPLERGYLMQLIQDDLLRKQEIMENLKRNK